jgi:hypothetical protein
MPPAQQHPWDQQKRQPQPIGPVYWQRRTRFRQHPPDDYQPNESGSGQCHCKIDGCLDSGSYRVSGMNQKRQRQDPEKHSPFRRVDPGRREIQRKAAWEPEENEGREQKCRVENAQKSSYRVINRIVPPPLTAHSNEILGYFFNSGYNNVAIYKLIF